MMAETRAECSVGDRNEQRWWQWTGTSTDRTGGISIIDGRGDVTTEGSMFKGDGVGKTKSWRDGVCVGDQRLAGSEVRGQVVHPRVATLESKVSGEEV